MGTRFMMMVAAAAMATAVAATTIANSSHTPTPKQARLQGFTTKTKQPVEQTVGRLIVKLRDGGFATTTQAARASRVKSLEATAGVGMVHMRDLAGSASLVALGRPMPLSEAKAVAARLASDPAVEYAEPDIMVKRLAVPNDVRYLQWQWNLMPPTDNYVGNILGSGTPKAATAVGGANLPLAWDVVSDANSVVVAVIDSGIVNHTDLNQSASYAAAYSPGGRFLAGYDFISADVGVGTLPANFVANDGDGRDADPTDPGDWVTTTEETTYPTICDDEQSGPQNSSWHGTHMAGVVGAATNNNLGVAAVAWNVRVLPIRAIGKCGGALSDIEEAIRWAAGDSVPGIPNNATPAKVISLSLGGGTTCSPSMQAAVNEAISRGSVVIAATGNDGTNNQVISPAVCNGAIGVTAHTINGENADYANVGTGSTISAAGGGTPTLLGAGGTTDDSNWTGYYVWSTVLAGATDRNSSNSSGSTGPAYAGFTGTSPATPQVAGVAALIKSVQPLAAPTFVKAWLTMASSTRPHPSTGICTVFAYECGRGLLDAQKAVQAAVDAAPAVSISNGSLVAAPNSTVILHGSVTPFGTRTATSAWSKSGGGTLSSTTGSPVNLTTPSTGTVVVTLSASDSAGISSSDSVLVRVNSPPVVAFIQNQTVTVGQTVSFTATATDPDGDSVFFTGISLPTGATISSTGLFSWDTTGASPGTYSFTIVAGDGLASGTATVSITLAAGSPPPTGGGGGGGALPIGQLLLLAALGLAARIHRRQ